MANYKNPVSSLAESQSQTMNNWLEAARKLQDSMMRGEVAEKGADIYRSWFEEQRNIVSSTVKETSQSMMEAVPNMANMSNMNNMMGNISNMMGGMMGNNSSRPMEYSSDMYRRFMDMQSDMMKTWMGMMQGAMPTGQSQAFSMQNPFITGDPMAETRKMYEQWMKIYEQWFSQSTKQFTSMRSFMSGEAGKTAMEDMLSSMKTYSKMFEVWQPIAKMMQENAGKMNDMMKTNSNMTQMFTGMVDPGRYKEVMDGMFKFMPTDQFKGMYEQFNKFSHDYMESLKNMQQQARTQMQEFGKTVSPFSESFSENAQQMMRQMEQVYAPFQLMMPAGRDKDIMEQLTQMRDKYADYWSKATEMQYMMYQSGQKSMEKLVADMMERAKGGDTTMNYNDFFNNWVNATESQMLELFNSDEFSKTQGEMLSLGMEIKRTFEGQLEKYMEAYPVVTRTEADEMTKTLTELRAQVRKLEKAVKSTAATLEDQQDEKEEKKTSRKTTTKSSESK